MLYLASDHAGFELKKHLVNYLKKQLRLAVKDLGPQKYDETDDYPIYATALTKKVIEDKKNKGVLICGSGHGVCLVANRFKGARAILGYSVEAAEVSRKDEDANILCLAGRVLSTEHATAIVKKFLETNFTEAERHVRRLKEIDDVSSITY